MEVTNMGTNMGISTAAAEKTTNSTSTSSQNALQKDDFLQLLITSLQYQDPMSPMENSDMMQQMAMLGLMEQSTNMATSVEKLTEVFGNVGSQLDQGASLLGKEVEVVDVNGVTQKGIAEKVEVRDGLVQLLINGGKYEMNQIKTVKNAG